jgi:hypothetical protein
MQVTNSFLYQNCMECTTKGGLRKQSINLRRLVNLLLINHMPACKSTGAWLARNRLRICKIWVLEATTSCQLYSLMIRCTIHPEYYCVQGRLVTLMENRLTRYQLPGLVDDLRKMHEFSNGISTTQPPLVWSAARTGTTSHDKIVPEVASSSIRMRKTTTSGSSPTPLTDTVTSVKSTSNSTVETIEQNCWVYISLQQNSMFTSISRLFYRSAWFVWQ